MLKQLAVEMIMNNNYLIHVDYLVYFLEIPVQKNFKYYALLDIKNKIFRCYHSKQRALIDLDKVIQKETQKPITKFICSVA